MEKDIEIEKIALEFCDTIDEAIVDGFDEDETVEELKQNRYLLSLATKIKEHFKDYDEMDQFFRKSEMWKGTGFFAIAVSNYVKMYF